MENQFNIDKEPKITWTSSLKMPFVIPDGYFEHFSELLMSEIKIENKNWSKKLPFQIPETNYFEQQVEKTVQNAKLHALKDQNKSTHIQDVPAQYFENLSEQVLSKIKALSHTEEEQVESIDFGSKAMPYHVPEGYFAGNIENLMPKKGKTVEMKPAKKSFTKQWIWMAASVALFVGFFGMKNMNMFSTNNEKHSMEYFESQLAKISQEEIEAYLNIYNEDIELNFSSKESEERFMEGMSALSAEEIELYLSE